jgi:hypothetical protein
MVFFVAAGCAPTAEKVDSDLLAAHRGRLILNEEPEGVLGVVEVREMLAVPVDDASTKGADSSENPAADLATAEPADAAQVPAEVVVVGRIGGVPNPWKQAQPDYPWSASQAQFVIADAAAATEVEEHSHAGHAHEDPHHDCPFCAEAANSNVVAVVRFTDSDGKVIPVDARQLFELEGDETVVVRGKAHLLGDSKDGVLMVDANGLYVRR